MTATNFDEGGKEASIWGGSLRTASALSRCGATAVNALLAVVGIFVLVVLIILFPVVPFFKDYDDERTQGRIEILLGLYYAILALLGLMFFPRSL